MLISDVQTLMPKFYIDRVRGAGWFLGIYLFVLAPKIEIQGVGVFDGGIVGILLLVVMSWTGRLQMLANAAIPAIGLLLFMFSWLIFGGILSGEIETWSHHYYFLVVVAYILTGVSVGLYWVDHKTFPGLVRRFLRIIVGIATLNSAIILLSFASPEFKALLEGLLYQSPGSNINYAERDNRLRGLAAGGAATQSLFLGAAILIGIALYKDKSLSFLKMAFSSVLILLAITLVGRIGFLILGVGAVLYVVLESIRSGERQPKNLLQVSLFILTTVALLPVIVKALLPAGVYSYALDLFYSGIDGLSKEGTVSVVAGMFHLPDTVRELLIGIGNGSGSFDNGKSSDPGYMKMLTAVGLPVAILFYTAVAWWSYRVARWSGLATLFIVLLVIWLISEVKEPFILKGYFARFMWLFIGIMFAYSLNAYRYRHGSFGVFSRP